MPFIIVIVKEAKKAITLICFPTGIPFFSSFDASCVKEV